MQRKPKGLTEIELQLMLICWDKGESPVSVVWEELNKKQKRIYSAVKTELDRLVNKEYLNRRRIGKVWFFSTAVLKSEVMPFVFDHFIHVLDDNLFPLFTYFANSKGITKEEAEYLRSLLDGVKNAAV
jgi:predicted transcriptional regulator